MLTPERCAPIFSDVAADKWWPVARGLRWDVAHPRRGVIITLTDPQLQCPPCEQQAREVAAALNRIYHR